MKKAVALVLSVCLALSGVMWQDYSKNVKADNLTNVANGKNGTTYMTSNANTGKEGFLYIGNGFSNINTCNENLQNGNNILGKTATTDEVALYVDLQADYNISSAVIYQGSTNANFYDSYCKKYAVYYSEQAVTAKNQGNVVWNKAGECANGTIYSSAKVKSASDVSEAGDSIVFDNTYKARSIKIVFDKESCMGTGSNGNNTGSTGTVSLLSVRIYGVEAPSENVTTNGNNQQESTTELEDDGVTDILFIGNSMTYYNTLCNVVGGIANRKGHNVRCTAATNGGRNLIFQSTAENVLQAIKKGGYEVVILQDIVGSFDADRLQSGAEQIIPIIKQYNPDAQIMFYEPWPTKDKILGTSGLLPYFTHSYIQTAKSFWATLAPAGESFYELYKDNGLDYYCGDNKHPQPLGTFTSASTIYYALYPEEKYEAFTDNDQAYLDNLINTNVAYTNEGKQETYSLETLNLIFSLGYKYTHAVIPAVRENEKYVSAAGNYNDPDEGLNPDGLKAVKGKSVDASVFTKVNGNMSVGCKAYASNEKQAAINATDGNNNTRWETEFADPQWLYSDLGSKKEFDTVGFIWEGAYAAKYYIQISDDAADWKTVSVVTASSADTVQIELPEKCSARYIRMYASKRGTNYGISFYEMGVWKKASDETTTSTEIKPTQEITTKHTERETNETTTVKPTEEVTTEEVTTAETTTKPTEEVTTVPSEINTTLQETIPMKADANKIKKVKIKTAIRKQASAKVSIKIKKVVGVKGYEIRSIAKRKVILKKDLRKNKSRFSIASKKIKAKKAAYVQVRAYVFADSKKNYGKWSRKKKIKIKK